MFPGKDNSIFITRRYFQEFETELNVEANGGFGFLRVSKLKSRQSDKTFLTKVISKENVCDWQLRNKTLIEADILSSIDHQNIVKVNLAKISIREMLTKTTSSGSWIISE